MWDNARAGAGELGDASSPSSRQRGSAKDGREKPKSTRQRSTASSGAPPAAVANGRPAWDCAGSSTTSRGALLTHTETVHRHDPAAAAPNAATPPTGSRSVSRHAPSHASSSRVLFASLELPRVIVARSQLGAGLRLAALVKARQFVSSHATTSTTNDAPMVPVALGILEELVQLLVL